MLENICYKTYNRERRVCIRKDPLPVTSLQNHSLRHWAVCCQSDHFDSPQVIGHWLVSVTFHLYSYTWWNLAWSNLVCGFMVHPLLLSPAREDFGIPFLKLWWFYIIYTILCSSTLVWPLGSEPRSPIERGEKNPKRSSKRNKGDKGYQFEGSIEAWRWRRNHWRWLTK